MSEKFFGELTVSRAALENVYPPSNPSYPLHSLWFKNGMVHISYGTSTEKNTVEVDWTAFRNALKIPCELPFPDPRASSLVHETNTFSFSGDERTKYMKLLSKNLERLNIGSIEPGLFNENPGLEDFKEMPPDSPLDSQVVK